MFIFNQFFAFISFFTDGLSWYIQDAAQILSTNIVKKQFDAIDRGEMLIFQNFMHSWVCYECVKILYVFGIQPKIRSDISDWSTELDSLFKFFLDKQANVHHKQEANKLLDCILTKTAHTSYFSKLHFGSKQKFVHYEKPILFLVILTWLRQLQQYFFTKEETDNCIDWNKHGRYWGTPTGNVDIGLGYVHMSTATSEVWTLVESFSYFKPSSKRKPGVVLSLEEWAANILQLEIPDILEDAKQNDSDTKKDSNVRKKQRISSSLLLTTQNQQLKKYNPKVHRRTILRHSNLISVNYLHQKSINQ